MTAPPDPIPISYSHSRSHSIACADMYNVYECVDCVECVECVCVDVCESVRVCECQCTAFPWDESVCMSDYLPLCRHVSLLASACLTTCL